MTGDITYAPIQAGSGGGAGGVGGAADSNGNHDFTRALEGSHSAIFGGSGGGGGSFGGSGGGFGGSFGNASMENGNTPAPAVVCTFFSNTMFTVMSGTSGFLCTPRASLDITLLFNFVCSSLFIPRTREVSVPELHCCAQYAWKSRSIPLWGTLSAIQPHLRKDQAFSISLCTCASSSLLAVGVFCIYASCVMLH